MQTRSELFSDDRLAGRTPVEGPWPGRSVVVPLGRPESAQRPSARTPDAFDRPRKPGL